LVHAISAVK